MQGLTKAQIIEVAQAWRIKIGAPKKGNLLALRAEIERVKGSDQRLTVKYAELLYDLLMQTRLHMRAADIGAYLSQVSDADVTSASFPPFEKEQVQALANQSSAARETVSPTSAGKKKSGIKNKVGVKEAHSDPSTGHQTLIGGANLAGNGCSIIFGILILGLIGAAIKAVFSG